MVTTQHNHRFTENDRRRADCQACRDEVAQNQGGPLRTDAELAVLREDGITEARTWYLVFTNPTTGQTQTIRQEAMLARTAMEAATTEYARTNRVSLLRAAGRITEMGMHYPLGMPHGAIRGVLGAPRPAGGVRGAHDYCGTV